MWRSGIWTCAGLVAAAAAWAQSGGDGGVTYKCPGNVYTNMISAQEAKSRGCTTIEGTPITIVQTTKPRAAAGRGNGGSAPAGASAARPGEARVDPAAQRQRDSDSRRILEEELRREEERLAQLQKDYNGGQPERRGDEQNFAKYQERVADMKSAIARKEGDIAAIKREIAKLPPPTP